MDTIYELTLWHVVLENAHLVMGFVLCCTAAFYVHRSRVKYFEGKELSKSKSTALAVVLSAMLLLITLRTYKDISHEAAYFGKLGHEIDLNSQTGVLKSLHNYSSDWDLTKFSIGDKTFSFRREEIRNTDFSLDQNEIAEFEGKLIEIVYAEDSRIVSFKVLNSEE